MRNKKERRVINKSHPHLIVKHQTSAKHCCCCRPHFKHEECCRHCPKCSCDHFHICKNKNDLTGIHAQLKASANIYLNNLGIVVFDTILHHTAHDISYNRKTGKFTLTRPANYLINWNIALEGSDVARFVRFALLINQEIYGASALPISIGQINGTSLIKTMKLPTTISLVNNTDDIVQLANITPIANITITKTI